MKNIKFLIQAMFTALLLTGTLVACSSEDIDGGASQKNGKGVRFALNFQDFEKDEQVTSRATADGVLSRDTVDLGNNIEAEVLVKSDNMPASIPATRATLSNGHYTVVAYQGSAVKGTIKGTWNGTAFVPDTGYEEVMQLPAGTYTFVCFNDKITQSGGTLTLTRSNTGNAALLGINKNVAVSGLKQSVSFAMKHAESRMKISLWAYNRYRSTVYYYSGVTTTLSSLNATDVPATANYDVATDTWSNTSGASVSETDLNHTTSWSADYHYFLPSTSGSSFKLTFNSGTVYGRNMTGKSLKLFTSRTLNMQANKSYTVTVMLHYKFTYLFSDGTTGTLAANPTKIPIGLVVNSATRTAVALNEASTAALWTTRSGRQNVSASSVDLPSNPNPEPAPTGATIYDGYNETWNAANSLDGTTVKATSTDFPAFKAAADYSPGVPTAANIGKWYLPAAGEFSYLRDTLSLGTTAMWNDTYRWAFTRAGGTALFKIAEYTMYGMFSYHIPQEASSLLNTYNTSSEIDNDKVLSVAFFEANHNETGTWGSSYAQWYNIPSCPTLKTQVKRVRPFVHY